MFSGKFQYFNNKVDFIEELFFMLKKQTMGIFHLKKTSGKKG